MAEERYDETPEGSHDSRQRRLRIALAAILVLLMLLLAVLGVFIVRVLTPAGRPDDTTDATGLEWVRSIYGYGPAEDQQLLSPTDVAVAPDGTIWATDPSRARLLAFDPDGSYQTLIHQGPRGRGEGRIRSPEGVAVSEDNEIYVADYGNNKVVVFTPGNEYLREWEVPRPLELDVRDGRVAVATIQGVALYDTQGELLSLIGERGPDEDQFDTPHGIAIAEDGTIFVSDTHNSRLKAYSADGDLLWTSVGGEAPEGESLLQIPAGLTIDGNGRLVFVDPFDFNIVVATADGVVEERYGEYGQEDGRLIYPTGIDYDPARDWFVVADTTNDRLQIVRIEGSGGSLLAALARLGSSPYRICAIPLLLLLIAIVVLVMRRRRARRATSEEDGLDFA